MGYTISNLNLLVLLIFNNCLIIFLGHAYSNGQDLVVEPFVYTRCFISSHHSIVVAVSKNIVVYQTTSCIGSRLNNSRVTINSYTVFHFVVE